jgi:hypothetical protein
LNVWVLFCFLHILVLLYSGLNVWVLFCTTINQKCTCNCVKVDWRYEFCFAIYSSWFYCILDIMFDVCSAQQWLKSAHVIVLMRIECLSSVLLFTHPDFCIADLMFEFCSAQPWIKRANVIVNKRIECLSSVLFCTHPVYCIAD